MSRKHLEESLKRLIAVAANHSLKLEYTLTEYPKVRKPKGWTKLEQGYSFSCCPRCGADARTWYKGRDDPDRPYTYYEYKCGVCGETWQQTKIWD